MLRHQGCVSAAVLAVLFVLLWQTLTVTCNYGGNWTALFCTGALRSVPPELAASTYVFPRTAGYDGQFYRYIAHDPRPDGPFVQYVDEPRLRYGRILIPALAYLTGAPDAAMIALIVLFTGFGVYWTGRYLERHGAHPGLGIVFAALPASLVSNDRMLLDGPLSALFAATLLYAEEDRIGPLLLACTAAPMIRETGIFLPAAAFAQFTLARQWKRSALFAGAALPALAWWWYVGTLTPVTHIPDSYSWPVVGIVARLAVLRTAPDAITAGILRATDSIALLALLAALVSGAVALRYLTTTTARVAVGLFVVLGAILTGFPEHLTDPYGFARPISPLLLALVLVAFSGGSKWNLLPAAGMSLALGIQFISPAFGILKAVIGH